MSQRFTVQGELNRIDAGLRSDAQHDWGTQVKWWRWNPSTTSHDTYDVGSPRQWRPFVWVPVLQAIATEGRDVYRDEGLYTSQTLQVVVAKNALRDHLHWFGLLTRAGLNDLLRDRIEYEHSLYTINDVQLEGQLHNRDVIVAVSAREVKSDEQWIDEPPPPESLDPVYDQ